MKTGRTTVEGKRFIRASDQAQILEGRRKGLLSLNSLFLLILFLGAFTISNNWKRYFQLRSERETLRNEIVPIDFDKRGSAPSLDVDNHSDRETTHEEAKLMYPNANKKPEPVRVGLEDEIHGYWKHQDEGRETQTRSFSDLDTRASIHNFQSMGTLPGAAESNGQIKYKDVLVQNAGGEKELSSETAHWERQKELTSAVNVVQHQTDVSNPSAPKKWTDDHDKSEHSFEGRREMKVKIIRDTQQKGDSTWSKPSQPIRDLNHLISFADLKYIFGILPSNQSLVEQTTYRLLSNYDIRNDTEFKNIAKDGSLPRMHQRYAPIASRGWGGVLGGTSPSIPSDHLYHVRNSGDINKGYGMYASVNLPSGTVLGSHGGELLPLKLVQDGQYCWGAPSMVLQDAGTKEWITVPMALDASKVGNLLRFVNDLGRGRHNLEATWFPFQNTWTLFYETTKAVAAGEELSISYGEDYWGKETRPGEDRGRLTSESRGEDRIVSSPRVIDR